MLRLIPSSQLSSSTRYVFHPSLRPATAAAAAATAGAAFSTSWFPLQAPPSTITTATTPFHPRRASYSSSSTSPAIPMEKISTQGSAPPAAPYSQAIRAAGLIFVSGQIPADESGKLVEGSIAEVTRQCCKNVEAILKAGGSSLDKVVRVGVFLADMEYFAEMNKEYEKWFAHKPARACVAVRELPKSVKVEIEAIALA